MYAKANDAPGKLVHDHERPVGVEQNGLATKESRALAPGGIAAAGFQRPLTEPSVHLSLCTRLSRNHGEAFFCSTDWRVLPTSVQASAAGPSWEDGLGKVVFGNKTG